MNVKSFLSDIRNLIANDDLPAALEQLRGLLENSPKLDEAILQSARFKDIRRQIRLGMVSNAEASLTQNQIRAGLLDLLREIEDSVRVTGSHPDTSALRSEIERAISIVGSKNVVVGSTISAGGNVHIGDQTINTESATSRRLRVFLYFLVPVLAIGAAFLWYRFQEMKRPLSLKVRVENRTPNPELPEPSGKLTLTYGSKTEPKEGVAGEALFEGIPANFKSENLRLQFLAEGFVPVDTSFLFENEAIVLPVRRNDELAKITGVISDEAGKPLEGVKISIACCSALSDASGAFTLVIPFEHQRTSQRLDIFREGFKPKSVTTPVMPGETLRQVLEKI